MDENTILKEVLNTRQTQRVARALREAGYKTATAKKCRRNVIGVAEYFEPINLDARQILIDIICQVAGLQPRR